MRQLRRQAGLTLVELMVATTLSLVLLAGVLLVFQSNKATYQMQSGLGTLQENGRYGGADAPAEIALTQGVQAVGELGTVLVALLGIGGWASYRQRKSEDLFLGGRSMGWGNVGLSIFGTNIGNAELFISVTNDAQAILEIDSVREKLLRLTSILTKELEVLELGRKIQTEAQSEMEKMQREYFLREQLKLIRREMGRA